MIFYRVALGGYVKVHTPLYGSIPMEAGTREKTFYYEPVDVRAKVCEAGFYLHFGNVFLFILFMFTLDMWFFKRPNRAANLLSFS